MTNTELNNVFMVIDMGDVQDVFGKLISENLGLARFLVDIGSSFLWHDPNTEVGRIERLWIKQRVHDICRKQG